jgi:hypothetical protein
LPQVTSNNIELTGLKSPDIITSNGTFFNKYYATSNLFSSLANPRKITDTDYGPIYEYIKPNILDNVDISGRQLYLKLKDSTLVIYQLADGGSSTKGDYQPTIIWSDSSASTPTLTQNIIMTCGAGGVFTPIVKEGSSLISGKVQVGKTSDNKPVYQINDENNNLVKALYNNYKLGRDSGIITLHDFSLKHNHLLIKDSLGDWQVYANQEFAPMAECGKPVIYLYPQKDTLTTVKVAANVTKSEPTYPQNGWTVLAHPNGQIDYQNKTYPNLFWEGTGHGPYPEIKNFGFVVKQSELIPTIKKHLALQGLNAQESADFLDFWQSKLPTTPYTRLTWLGTADMNRLAPLDVSPRPDTSIRIFLDFEGLQQPINLTAQKLTSVTRSGFTLIEWGGLLIK